MNENYEIRIPKGAARWLHGDLIRLSFGAPAPCSRPLEFHGEVNHDDARVTDLSCSEDRIMVAGVIVHNIPDCERLTVGRNLTIFRLHSKRC